MQNRKHINTKSETKKPIKKVKSLQTGPSLICFLIANFSSWSIFSVLNDFYKNPSLVLHNFFFPS
jgi:hypothetical protein